jgi:hypothetical protein
VFAQRLIQDKDLLEALGATAATGASITVVHSGCDGSAFSAPAVPVAAGDTSIAAEARRSASFWDPASDSSAATAEDADGPLQLRVRTPSGKIVAVAAASRSEPILEVARRAAGHPELHMQAGRAAVTYAGIEASATDTADTLGLRQGDCLQLVMSAITLMSRPCMEDLHMACEHCEQARVPTELRPLCSVCRSEAVKITAGSCTVGAIRWEQLLKVRLECFECGAANKHAAFGFLCTRADPTTGELCPSRVVAASNASLAHRKLLNPFQCDSRQHLAATLQATLGGTPT